MAEKIEVGVVIKGADKAAQQIDGIDEATNNLGTGVEGVTGALDKMTMGAVSGFKAAYTGTLSFIKGLQLTKVALISTGIGAIVVLVGALVAAFMSTNENAKKMQVEMAGLGAIMERLEGYLAAVGGFIAGLFTGGVTKAAENYNKEMEKLPGTMEDAIAKAKELEARTQSLATAQRQLGVVFAKGRAKIKKFNMIAEDTSNSLEKRLEYAEKAIQIEQILMEAREKAAQEAYDIAVQQAAQSDTSEEDLDNLAQLEIDLINVRTESFELQTTLNNKINTIRKEAEAKAAAEAKAIADAEKEKQDAKKETQRLAKEEEDKRIEEYKDYLKTDEQLALDKQAEKAERLLKAETEAIANGEEVKGDLRQKLEEERQAIQKKFADQRQAIIDKADKDAADKKKAQDALDKEARDKKVAQELAATEAIKAANMGLVQAGFDALNAMAKTEEGQKKLAIAQILVNQGIALSNAIANAQASAAGTGPGAVAAAPIFTATLVGLVLSSFAQIKGIMNQAGAATEGLDTSMPSLGGGGSGSPSAGGGGAQLALTPDLAQSFNDALGSQAVQAYVVQQDLADANALQQSIANQASLGGG